MADDLGDEWWLQDDDISETEKVHTKKKLDLEDIDGNGDVIRKKSKRKRRTKASQLELNKRKDPIDGKTQVMSALNDYLTSETISLEDKNYRIQNFDVVDAQLEEIRFVESINEKLENFKKNVSKSLKRNGCPYVLVIAPSALRAIKLKGHFQIFSKDCPIAKLFAKHIKIVEQQRYLSQNVVKIAVGTPKRINELLDIGALSLDRLRYIMLDWYWRDVKLRRSVDIPEIKTDIACLLIKHLLDKVYEYHVRLVLM